MSKAAPLDARQQPAWPRGRSAYKRSQCQSVCVSPSKVSVPGDVRRYDVAYNMGPLQGQGAAQTENANSDNDVWLEHAMQKLAHT